MRPFRRETRGTTLQKFTLPVLIIVIPLFFFGGPDYYSDRLFKELWNLGHFIYSGLLAFGVYQSTNDRIRTNRARICCILLTVIGFALLIEGIQALLPERTLSVLDLSYSFAGTIFALCVIYGWRVKSSNRIMFWSLGCCVVCVLGLVLTNATKIIYSDYRSWRDFPVLSDFESSHHVSRWSGSNSFERVLSPVQQGRYALKINLAPGRYSGITLRHFPGNWKKASSLQFHIHNQEDGLMLYFRIDDKWSLTTRSLYTDRFNGSKQLNRGWNVIRVPLDDIEAGPLTRKLDLEKIRRLGLFITNSQKERTIHLDGVKLVL